MQYRDKKLTKMYMNWSTGAVDDFGGWWYENELGVVVNAVVRGECDEVVLNANGDWVAVRSSPAEMAKDAGLKSLAQVSKMTGVSPQTLSNWHKNKPELYSVVIAGCASIAKIN